MKAALLPLLLCSLAACERLGIPDPAKEAEAREAEGRAVGSACRHAGRALEDCYTMNPKSPKAAIFAGWKEMNDYMAENKIETVKPEVSSTPPAAKETTASSGSEETGAEEASSAKTTTRRKAVKADSGAH